MSAPGGQAAASGPGNVRKLPSEFVLPKGIAELKRCELPPEAFVHGSTAQKVTEMFARRPGFNTTGDNIRVAVNQFRVTKFSNTDVNQFDVSVNPEPKHSIVYKKIWESSVVKKKLAESPKPWIYDGHKLAWSAGKAEIHLQVDLDAEEGKASRPGNKFMLIVRPTGKVRMEALRAYLGGKTTWDTLVVDCINFLDHVLRQGPSERMKAIQRTFFSYQAETRRLNDFTEAVKGVFATMRLNESLNSGGMGLGVNVDVSNQTFFIGQKFEQVVRNFLASVNPQWARNQYSDLRGLLAPQQGKNGQWEPSEPFKALKRLYKLKFVVVHRKDAPGKFYRVRGFVFDTKYGREGGHAKAVKFDQRMDDGTTKPTTVYDYYMEKYNTKITHWYLPLIDAGKAGHFPFETCEIQRLNKYPFKLDPQQTSDMIKFAVQRPTERKAEIMKCVAALDWSRDKYLQSFGIAISPEMQWVSAKLIKNPEIQFAGSKKLNPRVSGRWDLRGMQFVKANKEPLTSWAFVILSKCIDVATLDNFSKTFQNVYKGHGGKIGAQPLKFDASNEQAAVYNAYMECGQKTRKTPQIIFIVIKDKNARVYEELKKWADCQWAIPTQVVLAQQARKANPQYCSNLAMKVNAKLGGQTSRVASSGPGNPFFKVPTVLIGVDVSHAAPGSDKASMAAMCMSMDPDTAVYNAAVETNGWRTEVLEPENIDSMLTPMVQTWVKTNSQIPQQVFYFRDGVSEGQFAHVMEYEYTEIQRVFKAVTQRVPKITVIIATKRHHIRFFPERGDRNGNPLPGTLVEREVTHPFQYDFYLCSHVAIQGTARPVHYNVIHDEIAMKPDDLQRMIYHQCYQYCRSTTPVSLHPAVYYSHLASNRARGHEPDTPQGTLARSTVTGTSKKDRGPCPKLPPLGGEKARPDAKAIFRNTMWFV